VHQSDKLTLSLFQAPQALHDSEGGFLAPQVGLHQPRLPSCIADDHAAFWYGLTSKHASSVASSQVGGLNCQGTGRLSSMQAVSNQRDCYMGCD